MSTATQAINRYTVAGWLDTCAGVLDVLESADEEAAEIFVGGPVMFGVDTDTVTHLYYALTAMRDQLRQLEESLT